jgi:hypothetical protein
MSSNKRYGAARQFGCEIRQTIILALRPPEFDYHITSLNVATLAQTLPERMHRTFERASRFGAQPANHWHRYMLRPAPDRPCNHRSTTKRKEIPSPHVSPPVQKDIVLTLNAIRSRTRCRVRAMPGARATWAATWTAA